jgi:hypothetical protein
MARANRHYLSGSKTVMFGPGKNLYQQVFIRIGLIGNAPAIRSP